MKTPAWYDAYSVISAFLVPVVIIIICYALIGAKLCAKMRARRRKDEQNRRAFEMCQLETKNGNEVNEDEAATSSTNQKQLHDAMRKASLCVATTQKVRHVSHNAASSEEVVETVSTTIDGKGSKRSKRKRPPSYKRTPSAVAAAASNREKRVLLQMSVLVAVFLLCWSPFWLFYMTLSICMRLRTCAYYGWYDVLTLVFEWLGYGNSFLNPIIYTVFNNEFRATFSAFFSKFCRS